MRQQHSLVHYHYITNTRNNKRAALSGWDWWEIRLERVYATWVLSDWSSNSVGNNYPQITPITQMHNHGLMD